MLNFLSDTPAEAAVAIFYLVYMVTLYGLLLGFLVVNYVLTGKSLSAIARRRGIEKPWLAWVPIGSDWLLGCISDQYRYVTFGEETNRRGKLLRRSILVGVTVLLEFLLIIALIILSEFAFSDEVAFMLIMLMLLVVYGMVAVLVVYQVLFHKCLFDLYRSCAPDKSLVFLLVGIFASYPIPFFVYLCRNKDLGMPPRQQLPETE